MTEQTLTRKEAARTESVRIVGGWLRLKRLLRGTAYEELVDAGLQLSKAFETLITPAYDRKAAA